MSIKNEILIQFPKFRFQK